MKTVVYGFEVVYRGFSVTIHAVLYVEILNIGKIKKEDYYFLQLNNKYISRSTVGT